MTIYLIAHYKFNHDPKTRAVNEPIDPRFLSSKRNYQFFLIDKEPPKDLQNQPCIFEKDFDPKYQKAGKQLAEWSTFLLERDMQFASYPMYILSSRFYLKNGYLKYDLNQMWDKLFDGLNSHGYGMLPSYDRPLRWTYPNAKFTHPKYQNRLAFFPFKQKAFDLIEDLYGIQISKDFPHFADLMSDYFGFASYEHFKRYLDFYDPIFDFFFTKDFDLKVDLSEYFYTDCSSTSNVKPVTYILEYFSHLFFALEKQSYFAYHHSGLYTIDTKGKKMTPIETYPVSFKKRAIRKARYMQQWIDCDSSWPRPVRTAVKAPFDAMENLIRKCDLKALWP
ncbi:MAG: hypothetical protein SP1CHLAM54_15440 [Chlamydiia bacterium]|nr:hypothetical protein [Chlamydiia bacterium]MCH9616434.1 hypothetical protein [Chlamydiia bacterium]MCH9629580.1 hypothetical protein [Chlamydiia bacterium]